MNSSTSARLRILAWSGVFVWAATITILSSMSPPQLREIAPFELWDKAVHLLAYLAGAVNLTLALRWSTAWPWPRVVVWAIVALSLFGIIDEVHQLFTPNRSGGDLHDWLADVLGAAIGAFATCFFHARSTRTPRLAPARD